MYKPRSVVFSGTLIFSTNKTTHLNITEILLKVTLNTIILTLNQKDKYRNLFKKIFYLRHKVHLEDLPQVTNKLYHIMLYTSPSRARFELTTLVVIGTDCIGTCSCKSNYHTGRGVQHYVIKFVSDLWQVCGFLRYPDFLHQ
jgi:hypothetical protein